MKLSDQGLYAKKEESYAVKLNQNNSGEESVDFQYADSFYANKEDSAEFLMTK